MNFELDEEQVMLKTAARDFLDKECDKKHVRAMMDDEKGYSPALWKKMADLGWLGLTLPEKYGGSGMTFLDLSVLLEECGRALLPAPVMSTVVHCAHPILAAGTEAQKQEFLPKIAAGDLIMTLAFTEPGGSLEASGVTVQAKLSGDSYLIEGTKLFVPDAHIADYYLCVARTSDGADKEKGITLFLIDAKSGGIEVNVLKTMSGEKLCEVVFNGVTVPKTDILGEPDNGWEIVKRLKIEAQVAESAWSAGGARWALETTTEYAKARVAFGHPIGAYQAVQHKLADIAVEVEGSTSIMYYAAWTIMEEQPDMELAAAMCKSWCSETYKHAVFDGVQLHGGIGFTWDHDMHLYFKRAKHGEVSFGDGDYHREKVSQLLSV